MATDKRSGDAPADETLEELNQRAAAAGAEATKADKADTGRARGKLADAGHDK